MSTLNAGETLQPFKPLRNNLIFDSSGNLVGIQNDRANGTDLRLNGGSAGTFSSLVVQAAGTFDLYNTADQTTNYERLRADWSGNVGRILTQAGGTGVVRGMSLASGTYAGTSGTTTALTVNPAINQSGTAGYTALDINPTETATGSGTKLLQRWAVGGTQVAFVQNNGTAAFGGLVSATTVGFSTSTFVSEDVVLNRDASDTLALRRNVAAQTFRVYNTYTDASNYERFQIVAGASNTDLVTFQAGTGSPRPLRMYTTGAQDLQFGTAGLMRWTVSISGHLSAFADNTYDIGASGANRPRALYLAGGITHGSATLLTTTTALTNGAAAATGTLTNAPTAGDPTKWIPINDNGTTRYIPAW